MSSPERPERPTAIALMPYDDHTRMTPFPCAMGMSEPMPDYRYAASAMMRRWVIAVLRDHANYDVISEVDALQVCEQQARLIIGNPLHSNEHRLMVEAVRDVIVVRETKAKNAEWLSDFQASGLGEIAS